MQGKLRERPVIICLLRLGRGATLGILRRRSVVGPRVHAFVDDELRAHVPSGHAVPCGGVRTVAREAHDIGSISRAGGVAAVVAGMLREQHAVIGSFLKGNERGIGCSAPSVDVPGLHVGIVVGNDLSPALRAAANRVSIHSGAAIFVAIGTPLRHPPAISDPRIGSCLGPVVVARRNGNRGSNREDHSWR